MEGSPAKIKQVRFRQIRSGFALAMSVFKAPYAATISYCHEKANAHNIIGISMFRAITCVILLYNLHEVGMFIVKCKAKVHKAIDARVLSK